MTFSTLLDGAVPKFLFVLLNLYLGFKIGQRSASSSSKAIDFDEDDLSSTIEGKKGEKSTNDVSEEVRLDEEVGDIADGDLAVIRAGFSEQCKMVLVVRTDLRLDSGTIASLHKCRCSKATLASYKALHAKNPQLLKHWERTGQAKIALKGKGSEQLLELEAIAKSLNLCARSVYDDSNLVSSGPVNRERVLLAIGPAPVQVINEVTGSLRLL